MTFDHKNTHTHSYIVFIIKQEREKESTKCILTLGIFLYVCVYVRNQRVYFTLRPINNNSPKKAGNHYACVCVCV